MSIHDQARKLDDVNFFIYKQKVGNTLRFLVFVIFSFDKDENSLLTLTLLIVTVTVNLLNQVLDCFGDFTNTVFHKWVLLSRYKYNHIIYCESQIFSAIGGFWEIFQLKLYFSFFFWKYLQTTNIIQYLCALWDEIFWNYRCFCQELFWEALSNNTLCGECSNTSFRLCLHKLFD